ncbi:hypothetical protein [Brachyspira pilosicoli]|uniref:hypothetical protein n=1 Tax=Brachyspira pilosicoli TaxID=52584 RepID=UPI003005FE19
MWWLCPHTPSSFTTEGSACGIGIKEPKELHLDEINTYILGKSSIELWSYYLLTKTRELIDFLFKERVKKISPDFI